MNLGSWQGVVSLLIDGGMAIAMVGLWLLWLQGVRRQRAVELKLEAASAQLKEASEQLNALMPLLSDLTDSRPAPAPASRAVVDPPARKMAAKGEPVPSGGDSSQTKLSRLLCLRREGVAAEQIARQLDMPLAQVKLLLQVHGKSAERSS